MRRISGLTFFWALLVLGLCLLAILGLYFSPKFCLSQERLFEIIGAGLNNAKVENVVFNYYFGMDGASTSLLVCLTASREDVGYRASSEDFNDFRWIVERLGDHGIDRSSIVEYGMFFENDAFLLSAQSREIWWFYLSEPCVCGGNFLVLTDLRRLVIANRSALLGDFSR